MLCAADPCGISGEGCSEAWVLHLYTNHKLHLSHLKLRNKGMKGLLYPQTLRLSAN